MVNRLEKGTQPPKPSPGWREGDRWPVSLPPVVQPVSRQPGMSRPDFLALYENTVGLPEV